MNNQKSLKSKIGHKKTHNSFNLIFIKFFTLIGLFFLITCTEKNKSEVKIGNQVWSSKNLNVLTFRNGDSITIAQTNEKWIEAFHKKLPALCYSVDEQTKEVNSILYNYYAISDSRGIAPENWHIAIEKDWNILFNEMGGTKKAFEFLKLRNNILNISDDFGYRTIQYDLFTDHEKTDTLHENAPIFKDTRIWSSFIINTDSAKFVMLAIDDVGDLFLSNCSKGYGCSVRCVKD
jgi:uncharacterized protein (TIGR02145 family)